MDWDDEYNDGYDDTGHISGSNESIADKTGAEGGLDPMDITNPISAYFFLSDDAQDEINGGKKKKMRCRSCSHTFVGESYDSCPECFSVNTEGITPGIDDEENIAAGVNMKCLNCGHTFVGEIYDSCPECFSSDTEEMID